MGGAKGSLAPASYWEDLQPSRAGLENKAIFSLPDKEQALSFCHRRSSSLVKKCHNWHLTCGSKQQKVPKKLEEPLEEHMAEESHAETDPSGLVFAVESPKHRIPQAGLLFSPLDLKNPLECYEEALNCQAAPREKVTTSL
ncbi:hypothetical protein DUI87_04855 [Hirundo rustica rustica]|uniref:Uncharacterized protein n=1 Tax=Hirundo rustica rustica TaxID=333673 RepID=A0A3M0KZ57_HIRRU|nr:hypothetical protein DUI87_04855 [Hirundo rustica rustica]